MPIENAQLGRDVRIFHPDLVNLYGCRIGDETRIGTFVEIQAGATILVCSEMIRGACRTQEDIFYRGLCRPSGVSPIRRFGAQSRATFVICSRNLL
jgi:hypothetical protein